MRFAVLFGAKVLIPAYLLFFIRFSGCKLSFILAIRIRSRVNGKMMARFKKDACNTLPDL
jgi:hypothetical protein